MESSVKIQCNTKSKTQDLKEISSQWWPLQAAPKPAPGFVLSSPPWDFSSRSSALSPVQ